MTWRMRHRLQAMVSSCQAVKLHHLIVMLIFFFQLHASSVLPVCHRLSLPSMNSSLCVHQQTGLQVLSNCQLIWYSPLVFTRCCDLWRCRIGIEDCGALSRETPVALFGTLPISVFLNPRTRGKLLFTVIKSLRNDLMRLRFLLPWAWVKLYWLDSVTLEICPIFETWQQLLFCRGWHFTKVSTCKPLCHALLNGSQMPVGSWSKADSWPRKALWSVLLLLWWWTVFASLQLLSLWEKSPPVFWKEHWLGCWVRAKLKIVQSGTFQDGRVTAQTWNIRKYHLKAMAMHPFTQLWTWIVFH